MSETGQLQRLTDEQVGARLGAYNPNGSLERDVHRLWDKAGDIIEGEVRDQFGGDAAGKTKAHYTGAVNAAWVQAMAEDGRRMFRDRTSVPAFIAEREVVNARIIAKMFERFADDKATL